MFNRCAVTVPLKPLAGVITTILPALFDREDFRLHLNIRANEDN